MDKVLILKFENAGVFYKHWKTDKKTNKLVSSNKDDRILTNSLRDIRANDQWINNGTKTFHYSFIENVLRVLVGWRPISRYRNSEYKEVVDNSISDISKRSYVKILSFVDQKKTGENIFVYEQMTTRKSLDNSWNSCSPNWEKMYRLLPNDLYIDLFNLSSSICSSVQPTNILFEDVADKLFKSKDPRVKDIINRARKAKAEPLAKLLEGNPIHSLQQAGFKGLGPYMRTLVVKGVSKIARIDGEICVPLSDTELELFKNGSGFATFLEGGIVTIKKIVDLKYNTLSNITNDFTPVEIS